MFPTHSHAFLGNIPAIFVQPKNPKKNRCPNPQTEFSKKSSVLKKKRPTPFLVLIGACDPMLRPVRVSWLGLHPRPNLGPGPAVQHRVLSAPDRRLCPPRRRRRPAAVRSQPETKTRDPRFPAHTPAHTRAHTRTHARARAQPHHHHHRPPSYPPPFIRHPSLLTLPPTR